MTDSNHTLSELHERIVYLWENKNYGKYTLETRQNHELTINVDGSLTLIHDNALVETNFNPSNKADSVRNFLKMYLPPSVYN